MHDLRRTSLTSLLQQGVDLAAVRDFAGHYSVAQTSRYVHPTMKSHARVAEASSRLVQMASNVGVDCVNSVDCVEGADIDSEHANYKKSKKIA